MKEPIYKNVFRCDSISAVDGFLPVRDVLKYEMFGDEGDKGFRNFEGVISNLEEIFNIKIKKSYFEPLSFEDLKSNEDARFEFVDKLIEYLVDEIDISKEYFNYGIWACDCPEDVVDSYNVSLEDVSKYKIKGVKLQDLGEEGALYGCKNYPEEVLDESTTKLIMDFNGIFNAAKLTETKVASKEGNLDAVYKWLPFLESPSIIALDKYVRDGQEDLKILFDCKRKGEKVSYKDNPDIWKGVSFRNQAELIRQAMDEYSDILAEARNVIDGDRQTVINNLSKLAQGSTYLNYLYLQTVATSANKRAKLESKSKYIQDPELKRAFLKGIRLEEYESPESDFVLFSYLNFILGNTLFNTLNGTMSQTKFQDNSGVPLNINNDNSPFISMFKKLDAHPFDDDPTFIPTAKSSKDGHRGYLGMNKWSVKLAKGEVTEDELRTTLDPEEFKDAMEGLAQAELKWGTTESPEPIAILSKWAATVFNNQIKGATRRAQTAEKKQQAAEEAFQLDYGKKIMNKPYSSEDERMDMEEEYQQDAKALYTVLSKNTEKVSDDPRVWLMQSKKMTRANESGYHFSPQLSAFIMYALLNPNSSVYTILTAATGMESKHIDWAVRSQAFGFWVNDVTEPFLRLQKNRALADYSEAASNTLTNLVNALSKLSGKPVPTESLKTQFRKGGEEYNKEWKDYGAETGHYGVISNTPINVDRLNRTKKPIGESMEINEEDFAQLYEECVTAGGMGGCINNFVPQNVLTVTDTKLGAIAPGSARGKFVKDAKDCDFENDTMKVHKKKAGKGDAITGTGIVYAKGKKMSESVEADDEDKEDHGYECCNCGADCTDYGVMINGDLYCKDCAEHEMDKESDVEGEEPETSEETCPNCGEKYDLNDPESFGIAKGRLWCARCAKKMKEKD